MAVLFTKDFQAINQRSKQYYIIWHGQQLWMALIIKDRTIVHQVLEIVISMLYKLVIYTAFMEKNKYLILNNLKSAKPNILCIKHNNYNDLSILNFYTNSF